MKYSILPAAIIAVSSLALAGCQSSEQSPSTVYEAPPEPGQTTFGRATGDAPPEPGQTTFSGPTSDSPPEPGQTTLRRENDPPEPGQDSFQ